MILDLFFHPEIPRLTKPPKETSRDAHSVSLRWRRWRRPRDEGDGPVTSYLIYYGEVADSATGDWQSVRAPGLSATVSDLEANTYYQFKILPVHEDGFVGYGSPVVNVSTCGGNKTSLLLE